MRSVLIGVMVGLVAVAGPASAGSGDAPCPHARYEAPCPHGRLDVPCAYAVEVGAPPHRHNPSAGVICEDRPNPGAEFGYSVAATTLNLLYHPLRLVFGATGAALGGFSGWVSGGDLRTAKGWWVNTTEGNYYIRPAHLDSSRRFRITGAVPEYPAPEYDACAPKTVEHEDELVVPDDDDSSVPSSLERRGG